MDIKRATNVLKFHFVNPVEGDTIQLRRKRLETTYRHISWSKVWSDIMKSCAKVVVVLFVLCAIHACLAKPKWLWSNEDVMDDLALEADDRRFESEKREMSIRKLSCDTCRTSNCYGGVCYE